MNLCTGLYVSFYQDMVLKNLIMECVTDWRDEFKFESWGDVFAQGVKDLEETGTTFANGSSCTARLPAFDSTVLVG